ncbi:MotA/TolQ/ExbB proton channel family protein [Methanobrevibacter ruminantium M1]|uniref:MotA/TolQ/ExbB proton channel family protein n=1 Tax=Methanobrevibacter ruminantium (strain ATCC 35063 / DSM 1093 / JCM 13430 / OCM 146 / M1) TaxID=634498 RepID=D3E1Z5_METRM|nr:MotA/TolQ/ExbB proton channel family protein [Methanobrevibacter ruminantium]ADC46556.1 MotA/TolQ/ExbB proton channel family protein [Methanobrevibacter ruminantium M1]
MVDVGGGILTYILDTLSQSLQIPVIIFLLIFAVGAIILLGGLIREYSHRKTISDAEMRNIIDAINKANDKSEILSIVDSSDIPNSQKTVLREITDSDWDNESRVGLAKKLISSREKRLEKRLSYTDIITRIGPTLGLMGTLIPMGPGLAALGTGDVVTLSNAIIVAFDTTVVGIGSGALAYVISKIRRRWYSEYINNIDVLTDVVLNKLNKL